MNCKLEKISRPDGVGGGLRTDVVEGTCGGVPIKGFRFEMQAKPLAGGDLRIVSTSPITEFELVDGVYTVKTRTGSVYKITMLD